MLQSQKPVLRQEQQLRMTPQLYQAIRIMALPLAELRPPQQGVIRRVEAEAADFLRCLETVGLVPEVQVEILDYSPFDQNIRLLVDGNELVLGPGVTGRIFVEMLVPEV